MALLTFFNGASSLLLLAIPSMMTSTSSESTESIFQQHHHESFTNLTTSSTNLTSFNNATIGVNQAKMKNVEKQIYIPITNFDLNVLHTILMIFYGQYFDDL